MIKKDRVCPYHSVEGKEKYQVCSASGKVCYCDANEWYCDHLKEWDAKEEEKGE